MRVSINFENKPLLFKDPSSIIRANEPSELPKAFDSIEQALSSGRYVAGFLSYEAGYSFEECLFEKKRYDFPLMMMGVYEKAGIGTSVLESPGPASIKNLELNIDKDGYSRNIGTIRDHIANGDVYQITYCIKMKFSFSGDHRSLYSRLYRAQPVPYPAMIETDDFKILSLSPERFIRKSGGRILSEPMKGTWMRGRNILTDLMARYRFSRDMKNRAENVMIADLLRNDLGRVGREIKAPKLFTITKYRTLYQMTSTVTGVVDKDIAVKELFAAIFPSGSVTGAPRIRAMQIIRGLEKEERRIYTGAIGYISPDRDMYFNIPIRTILMRGGMCEMGIGGGIVWDSTPQGEWDEGLLKAKFLTDLSAINKKQ